MKNHILTFAFISLVRALSAQEDSTYPNYDSTYSQNMHATRYAFSPSAFPIPKGALYYQTYSFVTHDIQVGVTKNFSMGLGYALPAFAYLTPKYSFKLNEKTRMAIGDMAVTTMFVAQESSFKGNIAYTMITRGKPSNNMTLGIGLMSHNISGTPNNLPVINAGGMLSVTKNIYLVMELWGVTAARMNNYTQTSFVRDANGNIKTNEQNGFVNAEMKTENKSFKARTNVALGVIQFRIIGNEINTKSWSFGLSAYSQSGNSRTVINEFATAGWGQPNTSITSSVVGTRNRLLVLPSVTYVKKFGDISKSIHRLEE